MSTKVLVVDDQMLVRAGFMALLDAEPDIEVVGEASEGAAAVAMARRHQPDVVLMDVRMPVMDGVQATRQIVADSAGAVAVLILTTFDLDEYVYNALVAGASGFLVKDTPPEDLVKAVRVIADGGALLTPMITKRLIRQFAANRPAIIHVHEKLSELTERETEVGVLVAQGLSNADIARKLFVSEATVKTHLNRAMAKLKLSSRAQVVAAAYETGLVLPGR